jgi:hypothetical protein
MTRWMRGKRAVTRWLRRWRMVLTVGVAGAIVLRGSLGVSWSGVGWFLVCLYAVQLIAEDAVAQWFEWAIAPGTPPGVSLAHPRVWTFTLRLTYRFLDEIAA